MTDPNSNSAIESDGDNSSDRGSPQVKIRSGTGPKAFIPAVIAIIVGVCIAVGSWWAWQSHIQTQEQAADSAGNIASKTSVGKRRNNEIAESSRRLGADGEESGADAKNDSMTKVVQQQVPAIAQENPRPNAQPIPVQGSGVNGQPAPTPRDRYDAPMSFGATATGYGYPGADSSQGSAMRPGITKALPGTRPDYSVPAPAPAAPSTPQPEKGALNLNTMKTAPAQASLIGNRNFILAKGGSIDCDLDTAIRSNTPGMVRCTTIKDSWSDNGQVVLVERGSTLTGEYKTETQQGQAEIQVIWNRLLTTHGVVVELASPATDALGRAGIDGDVDNHWISRVGSAFLLSTIKDVIGYATATQGKSNAATGTVYGNSTSTGESMANTILKQTIAIPPTITRNQGTRVKVFVARDLDFSKVYDLQPNRSAHVQ